MRFLNSTDVRQALTMDVAVDLMRSAFEQLGLGHATVPVRTLLPLGEGGNNRALIMPANLPSTAAGLKMITIAPGNSERGIPVSHAVVVVADPVDGRIRAIIEAEELTAIRTGAGSGLATDLLASSDATVAAIFGAGKQAETQLEAVCAVRPIERAIVFNRTIERAEAYARTMSERLEIDVIVARGEAWLSDADIICTATASAEPVLKAGNLKAGAHINGVGSYRPDMAEVPADVVVKSLVIADHIPAVLAEAGDILQPIGKGLVTAQHIAGDLGSILVHGVPSRDNLIWTFFKSVGNACQDVIVGEYLARVAEEQGLGIDLPA